MNVVDFLMLGAIIISAPQMSKKDAEWTAMLFFLAGTFFYVLKSVTA